MKNSHTITIALNENEMIIRSKEISSFLVFGGGKVKIDSERTLGTDNGMGLVDPLAWALHSWRALNLNFQYYPQLRFIYSCMFFVFFLPLC